MKDYKQYRWFFTSSGKLVVGGKSSKQNEELVKRIMKNKDNYVAMHTINPGSPFSFIIESIDGVNEKDLEEAAIFTACFSKDWKKGKKTAVHVFKSKQIHKKSSMKEGTFGVFAPVKEMKVDLKLVLVVQKGELRAVPVVKRKEKIIAEINPGEMSKDETVKKIFEILKKDFLLFSREDIEKAIPAGNLSVNKR